MTTQAPQRNLRIRVHFLWPAGYSCGTTETFDVNRWVVRDGVLILIRGAADRTHVPLASIAKWEVGV